MKFTDLTIFVQCKKIGSVRVRAPNDRWRAGSGVYVATVPTFLLLDNRKDKISVNMLLSVQSSYNILESLTFP